MKEDGFKLAKERSRTYPTQTTTNADYPAQAEFLLHSLERAAAGIGLHVNADKTEYMLFNQRGDTSTRKNGLLKQIDKFSYLGSRVSPTENDINTELTNAWIAIDKLSAK